jgi:hypothetical protein
MEITNVPPQTQEQHETAQFNSFKNFIHELKLFFETNLSLKLYDHLLGKTNPTDHIEAVRKHLDVVTKFVKSNRKEILESNTALSVTVMKYSERVKVDFGVLFAEVLKEETAAETLKIIFDHLLVLSMVFDPESGAIDVFKERKKNAAPPELEDLFNSNPFLQEMMEKVEAHVTPGANPMEAMNSMLSSGFLQEMVGGMQENIDSGKLDIGQLMQSVQSITQSLPSDQLAALQPLMQGMGAPMPDLLQTPQVVATPHQEQIANHGSNGSNGSNVRGGKKKRKKNKHRKKKGKP